MCVSKRSSGSEKENPSEGPRAEVEDLEGLARANGASAKGRQWLEESGYIKKHEEIVYLTVRTDMRF